MAACSPSQCQKFRLMTVCYATESGMSFSRMAIGRKRPIADYQTKADTASWRTFLVYLLVYDTLILKHLCISSKIAEVSLSEWAIWADAAQSNYS